MIRSFPDLIQCCSTNDKQLALKFSIIPSLEYYRSMPISNNTEMIECLVQTLPNLLFDIVIDTSLESLLDTLISLSILSPSLLIHTLPALGCVLTSTTNCLNLNISDAFVHLIIKLTQSWSLSNDGIDNLCHLLIILLQKCPMFRQVFYTNLCHLRLYERFQLMLSNKLAMQSSILASVFVAISYSPRPNDEEFNYKSIIEQITLFSEKNRYNRSWFELLVRLSLSRQYHDKQTRWKSSLNSKNATTNEIDDEGSTTSALSVKSGDVENQESIDEDEIYNADIESLSDEIPIEKFTKQNYTIYSNLILFPELVILGLKLTWENVDNEWNEQQVNNKISIYVSLFIESSWSMLSWKSIEGANSRNTAIFR